MTMEIYLQALTKIVNECFFLYPKQQIFNAWNIESAPDFFENKADLLLKKIIELKIPAKYLKDITHKLQENYVKYPPSLLQLIDLMKPVHNYERLFRTTQQNAIIIQQYLDGLNSHSLDKLCKFSYNIYEKMKSLKGINIISKQWCNVNCGQMDIEFKNCSDEFIEVFNLVDFIQECELLPIPAPIIKIDIIKSKAELEEEDRINKENIKIFKEVMQSLCEKFTVNT